MMCGIHAASGGRKTILLDHSKSLGAKILISGGGRCNFTNLYTTADSYVSENPHFVKSALSRYGPGDFIELVEKHGIAYRLDEPKEAKRRNISYSDNFKFDRKTPWTH